MKSYVTDKVSNQFGVEFLDITQVKKKKNILSTQRLFNVLANSFRIVNLRTMADKIMGLVDGVGFFTGAVLVGPN